MKRSRHRWLAFTVICAIILATIPNIAAVRATSLIFGKTSTTAAPEEAPSASAPEDSTQIETTASEGDDATNTTSKFSGIPQIDYIYDPNLPRELNGYNLSEYPFYETVPKPELIDFKCDGLHDGFYASVPHKCQVYHHCLFGTRYDFLCANYTAFDQKTFICQFVSEVDCKNSPNYFSRNDALYVAATTTTIAPPTTTTTTTTPAPAPARPLRRRRPYHRYEYDDDEYYYEDDYDYADRGRGRGRGRGGDRRPGKRRPYEYEDDRYESRQRPRDEADAEEDYEERRPYEERRRPGKRYYDRPERRPYDDEDRKERPERPAIRNSTRRPVRPRVENRYSPDDDRPRSGQRNQNKEDGRRDERPRNEMRPRDEARRDESRPRDDFSMRDEAKVKDDIRPRDMIRPRDEFRSRDDKKDDDKSRDEIRRDAGRPRDEFRSREEIKPRDEIRSRDEIKSRDERGPRDDVRPQRPSARDERRPTKVESDGKRMRDNPYEGRRYREDRPYRNRDDAERPYKDDDKVEEKRPAVDAPLVKPNGHGLFSQPRMPPKVKRPVPANEKNKYEYTPVVTTKAPPKDDYYYEEYEDDDTSRPSSSGKTSTIEKRPRPEPVEKERFKPSRPHRAPAIFKPKIYDDDYDYEVKIPKYEKPNDRRRPSDDDYYEYDDKRDDKPVIGEDITYKIKDLKPNVKVVRRPFLPSRGGSPYLPRGLQPVAGRNLSAPILSTPKPTTTTTEAPTTTIKITTTPKTTTQKSTTTSTTTKPTTTSTRYTTTTRLTTTTEPTTTTLPEYEYYDEDEDYEEKDKTSTVQTTTKEHKKETTTTTTAKPTSTTQLASPEERSKNFANKVMKSYNENYEAIQKQLETTLTPGDYLIPYLATQATLEDHKPSRPQPSEPKLEPLKDIYSEYQHFHPKPETYETHTKSRPNKKGETQDFHPREVLIDTHKKPENLATYKPVTFNGKEQDVFKPILKPQPKPEISKPYTATGKPILETISIKHNLADSIENDYDVRLNEALAPSLPPAVNSRTPSGFIVPVERDYAFSRFRTNLQEPQYAASELYQLRKRPQISGVSIRTPTSYFLHPQRLYEDGVPRHPRQLIYRQVLPSDAF